MVASGSSETVPKYGLWAASDVKILVRDVNRFRTISGPIPNHFQTVSGDWSGMESRTFGQPLPEPKISAFSYLILHLVDGLSTVEQPRTRAGKGLDGKNVGCWLLLKNSAERHKFCLFF